MTDEDRRLEQLAEENDALRRAVRTLHQIANLVRESPSLEPTCYALLTGVTAGVGLGLNRAMLFMIDEADRQLLRGVGAVGPANAREVDRVWKAIESDALDLQILYEMGLRFRDNPGTLARRVKETAVPVAGDNPVALALREGRLVHRETRDDLEGLFHLPTCAAAPLRGRHRIQGVLYADNRFTGRTIDPVSELVFSLIADQAGRAIDHAYEYERLAHAARTDALTGLGHHGAMMAAVHAALAEAVPTGSPVGLAMIDLDDFKQVNDRHGHLAGDALLAGVADRLRAEVRAGETPFRYGGEEFAVLLPAVAPAALELVGERLRRAIGDRAFELGADRTLAVTCSVGLAAVQPPEAEPAQLIEAADQALLRAKAAGKNCVVLADGN